MSEIVNDDNRHGFFWHVHHGILIEWCHDYNERAEYIHTGKPSDEQETRLRLFQPVKGSLPEEVIKAGRAYGKAGRAYGKAWRAYNEAQQAFDEAWRAFDEARQARDKAYRAFNEAGQAYDKAVSRNMSAIKALHAEECPNCPWNGHTIFPKA